MKDLLFIMVLCMMSTSVDSQISVMQYSGDSFTYSTADEKAKYKKVVFGPLPEADMLLVKENATLKLLNENNEICRIKKEGEYPIASLKFKKAKSTSLFDKFCDYFHSFFVNHSSSESKANYKNSIHAISRGKTTPPQLDYPLAGLVPYTDMAMQFAWSHACDSCQYVVSVNDLETRANIYAWTTMDHKVTLDDASQFIGPNKKYYWTVAVSGEEMEYPVVRFKIGDQNAYQQQIKSIKDELKGMEIDENSTPETIYIMSRLEEEGLINYAIHYGRMQADTSPKDSQLGDFVDRFWYDALLNR